MRLAPLVSATIETLYPPTCPVCRADTGASRSLCPSCWSEIAFLGHPGCQFCARPILGAQTGEADLTCQDCLQTPPLWQRGAAVFRYEGIGRRLVLGLKHGDRMDIVPMLGDWLLRAGQRLLCDADLVVPVPMHWSRRLRRRCNQAAELARWLTRMAGRPYAPASLVRKRHTGTQGGKDRIARVDNLANAFTARHDLSGQRILLVDDVLTTGATLNACARVCLAAGASAVDILVLALVIRDRDRYMGGLSEDEDAYETG